MTSRQVVVGVDGSPGSVRALDRAAQEAELRGAALDIVYAVPDADVAGPVLVSSSRRARSRHPGLRVTARAVVDGPVRALARHGRNAELTVVGSRGLGRCGGLLLGSVGRRLSGRLRGPLLVVRGDRPPAGGAVLLWSAEESAADAAAFAFAEAERRGVALRVRAAPARPPGGERALAARAEPGGPRTGRGPAARDAAAPGGHPAATARAGSALPAATGGAGLVVVAAGGDRPARRAAAVRALLRLSRCPVAIVPETRARGIRDEASRMP